MTDVKPKEKWQLLLERPQWQQRTKEWHDIRKCLITASSNVAEILGGPKSIEKLLNRKKTNSATFKGNRYTEHGVKYEQIVKQIYEHRTQNRVHEIGLVKHATHECLAASPDGVVDNGRLIEIKCPYKRVIDGKIPRKYYIQIQTQLQVCDLEECEFVECCIREYQDSPAYYKDGSDRQTNNNMEKGIIGRRGYGPLTVGNVYYYPDFSLSSLEQTEWLLEKQNTLQNDKYDMYFDFWRLEKYNCQVVERDDDWWEKNKIIDKVVKVSKRLNDE